MILELVIAIISATAGQVLLSRQDLLGLVPYALAIGIFLFALWQRDRRGELIARNSYTGSSTPVFKTALHQVQYYRALRLILSVFAVANAVLAFLAASDNTYRAHGVLAWLLAIGLFLAIFWERDPCRSLWQKIGFSRDGWRLSWTILAIIGLLFVGFWFRFWHLDRMPSEMTSDHIEKLLDVHDLTTGQRPIFFVRNTGREPWQFYWTLMFIRLFDLETKYFALKLGTAAVGLLMLPGVYLLGRHLFSRRVGLWAMLFSAVASWPVILSRVGLRFPFAPAATAWSLFYLLRGLRDGRRNDFLLLGLWLGIGMQGYTAFRAMPLAVVVCWALALIVRPASLTVRPSMLLRNALLTVLIASVVFAPLGRFSLEHADDFWRRSFSRVADPNHPISDGPILTFLKNLWNLALMFHWQGDDVWVNTLSDSPVLDPLLGGLFLLGLVAILWRTLRLRDPIAPLLLIAGAILILPSALSLAYPIENPSVVRSGGAIPVVMIIAALPVGLKLERRSSALQATRHSPKGVTDTMSKKLRRSLPAVSVLILAAAVTIINYQRYFSDYWRQYERHALNTTEVASAIQGFEESGGNPANAWIVAWPHWIDTRGVGIELGDPPWNNVILDTDALYDHAGLPSSGSAHNVSVERPRFYVLHPEDRKTLEQLRLLFPSGWSSLYISDLPYRDFVLFYVPRESPKGLIRFKMGTVSYAP